MTLWQAVRRIFLYLGIALACLAAFTLIFALTVRTGVVIPFRWVMLGLFTCVLIFAMIKSNGKTGIGQFSGLCVRLQ
jgi:FtsH-binding integral membrane protein